MEAAIRSDGSADLNSGMRFQLTRTQITAAKESELSRKTYALPVSVVLKAATIRPPSAGPTARARLFEAAFSVTLSGMNSRGTSSGTIACHAGLFIAEPIFSRNVKASSDHGEMWPRKVSTANTPTEPSIQL